MKIAITGPHFWPYRKRGSAAYIYNLSKHLAEEGHDVEIITGKPGKTRIVINGNVTINYLSYLQHPVLHRFNIDRVHMFTLNCFKHFIQNKYDIVYCMYHPDGFTLSYLRKLRKIRYVQLVPTVPFRFHWKHSPIDPYMFARALRGADACVAPSNYARDYMLKNEQLHCEHIPCGVDMTHFRPLRKKNLSEPRILCTAALHDERKNIPLLVKAFEMLLRDGTKAVLQLAAETTSETNRRLASLVGNDIMNFIEILPAVTHTELPDYYSEASVTVLPSVSETFGMTLIESLACGTPVVGTQSGALPEIINNPDVGSLFAMDSDNSVSVKNLYHALKKTLDVAREEKTVERCREHVRAYDWKEVTRKMISFYERILSLN